MTELSWGPRPRALSLGVNLLSREGNSQKWRMKDKTLWVQPQAVIFHSHHFWLDLRSVTFTLHVHHKIGSSSPPGTTLSLPAVTGTSILWDVEVKDHAMPGNRLSLTVGFLGLKTRRCDRQETNSGETIGHLACKVLRKSWDRRSPRGCG